MKQLIIASVLTLSFATPHTVSAEAIQPTIYTDPIILIEQKPLELAVVLQDKPYKEFKAMEVKLPPVQAKPVRVARSESGGNTYFKGQCTWHAKNMRPDLPNNLGNANSWYARAAAQGIPTGTMPRAGAVGMAKSYMHVVYIQQVNGDGTVRLSEMNYRGSGGGPGIVSFRNAPASEFVYIY